MGIPPPPADPGQLASAIPPPPDDPSHLVDAVASPQIQANSQPMQFRENGEIIGNPSPNSPDSASFNAFGKGLATNQPTQGFAGMLGRASPSALGGMIAGPAGAAAFESGRQALSQGAAVSNNETPASPLSVVGNVGLAAGLQYASDVAAPYISAGVQKVSGALGNVANSVLKYNGINLAGVKPASYAIAEDAPQAVSKYLNADASVGDSLAQNVRNTIGSAIEQGKAGYPALIDAAKANPAYATKTFDLSGLNKAATDIADKFGFLEHPTGSYGPSLAQTPGTDTYWKFAGQLSKLDGAPLDTVYQFQKQLNNLAQSNYGTPLGSAFGQLKSAASDLIGQQVPEIGAANASYAAAKQLEEQTGKLTNANDLLGYLTRVYRNPESNLEREAIENAASKIPGLSDAINEVHNYKAAQDFAPLIRSLPQTGMGASIAKGFLKEPAMAAGGTYAVTKNPLLAALAGAATAATNVVTSPRLALSAMQASQAAGPVITAAASNTAQALTPLASQAFGRMSPESISAFYRSPGQPSQ